MILRKCPKLSALHNSDHIKKRIQKNVDSLQMTSPYEFDFSRSQFTHSHSETHSGWRDAYNPIRRIQHTMVEFIVDPRQKQHNLITFVRPKSNVSLCLSNATKTHTRSNQPMAILKPQKSISDRLERRRVEMGWVFISICSLTLTHSPLLIHKSYFFSFVSLSNTSDCSMSCVLFFIQFEFAQNI